MSLASTWNLIEGHHNYFMLNLPVPEPSTARRQLKATHKRCGQVNDGA